MLLMHKDDIVAEFSHCSKPGYLLEIKNIYKPELFPISQQRLEKNICVASNCFALWIKNKTNQLIYRPNDIPDTIGVSPLDTYWIKEDNSTLTWQDVNCFENDFYNGYDYLNMRGADFYIYEGWFDHPERFSDPTKTKYWVSINGNPFLVNLKTVTPEQRQMRANEIVATRLANKMGIPHTMYYPIRIQCTSHIVTACSCITKIDVCAENLDFKDFIPAREIAFNNYFTENKDVLKYMEKIDKKGVERMKVFDYLLCNQERDMKEVGLLRDADTLQFSGISPLTGEQCILGVERTTTKNKRCFEPIQLKDIRHFPCKLPEKVECVGEIKAVYKKFNVPEDKITEACNVVTKRLDDLRYRKKELEKDRDILR